MGFQADVRAAAVSLLTDYATTESVQLQVYPARPRSIYPPTAFVDAISESVAYPTSLRQRRPQVTVIVVHALYDGLEAATQKDEFVDGFLDYVDARYHEAGANTMFAAVSTSDIPDWVPDWFPPDQRKTYYATEITLEGYALG